MDRILGSTNELAPDAIKTLLKKYLQDPDAGFSIGAVGALAEFHSDEDRQQLSKGLGISSTKGAIRLERLDDAQAIAFETLSAKPDAWQHGIAIFISKSAADEPPDVLTELGEDTQAIQEIHRHERLFDLGVGVGNARFCVRTGDPDLIKALRASLGTRIVDVEHPLTKVIVAASPHRVVFSQLGRIEVYQKIPIHRTPSGAHTHLLPKLAKQKRTHFSNVPIPPEHQPVLTVHPAHPLFDNAGERRTFNVSSHNKFQTMLKEHGHSDYVFRKEQINHAVLQGDAPTAMPPARTPLQRLATRIALRQLAHLNPAALEGSLWSQHFRNP
ncbi:MAG: hypothetical protein AAF384_17840 [Pseudomonadota bacterium]